MEAKSKISQLWAYAEASRCLLCLDAPCSQNCPAKTNPADFIRALRFKNLKGAKEIIYQNNALGAVCSRVCPTEKYCQSACSRCGIDKAIEINKLQQFLTDYQSEVSKKVVKSQKNKGKVVIIGSGPSGLQAASTLCELDYDVTVYEKNPILGGWLNTIPEHRLPEEIVLNEVKMIEQQGTTFITNTEVGKDISLDELKAKYDAVILSTGYSSGKMLELFSNTSRVYKAVDFLYKAKNEQIEINPLHKNVIIGGGDVAMDVCTTLKELGSTQITCVARETLDVFLASKKELEHAREMNISIIDGYTPISIDNNKITFKHVVSNSSLILDYDNIYLAVGQAHQLENLGINTKSPILETDDNYNKEHNVFVCGDIANGDKSVVYAIKLGRETALSVDKHLKHNQELKSKRLVKDLSIDFCGVKFPNPFCLSSSPVGNCYDMCAKAYDAGWGGVVFKTIGFFIADEVSPRFDKLDKESTSFVGFKNLEQIAEHPLEENLEHIRRLKENYKDKVLIASIMGENEREWEELARLVEEAGADMIECNFSCPQMTSHAMGSDVGSSASLVKKYCEAVKRGSKLPVLAKMTPNITDMTIPAIAAMEGGADGIAAINTIKSITNLDLNLKVGMPIVNGKSSISGYSGKAVKPIALRFIQQMKDNPKLKDVPISGIGGIENWVDATEFFLLGAKTLQVTTSIMQYGYRIIEDLISGLSHFLEDNNYNSLEEIIGLANKNIIPCEDLDRSYIVYPNIDLDKCVKCGRCYISCYDGGHQAITFDYETRTPSCDKNKCVGCHLCSLVCPVDAISKGEIKYKKDLK